MAVQSGVLEQMEAHGMGAVGQEQGLCALELAASGIVSSVVGMAPVRWPVLLAAMGSGVTAFLSGFGINISGLTSAITDAAIYVSSLTIPGIDWTVGGLRIPVTVRNDGHRVAANVEVRVCIGTGEAKHEAGFTVDFVPRGEGGL